jgi:hypothetical protein
VIFKKNFFAFFGYTFVKEILYGRAAMSDKPRYTLRLLIIIFLNICILLLVRQQG